MTAAERYVRLCPTHRTTLRTEGDGFGCSRCGGRIGRWVIHDLQKDKDVEEGTDEAFLEAQTRKARLPAGPLPETSTLAGIEFVFSTRRPTKGSQVVVAQAKLVDADNTATMMVRLFRRTAAVPYVVDWVERAIGVPTAGPKKDSGRAWFGLTETLAHQAFRDTVGAAISSGWLLAPPRFGAGRSLAARPVPPPPAVRARGNNPALPRAKASRNPQRRRVA